MYENGDNTDIQSRGDTFSLARIFGFGKTREEWRGPGHHGMKVYMAARYGEAAHMKRVANEVLVPAGFNVISTWINGNEDKVPNYERSPTYHDQALTRVALADLSELSQADCMLIFGGVPSGGRNFEMGYAYASEIPIFAIGPCDHVFHYLPEVYGNHFSTIEAWINYMKKGVTNEA